MEYGYGYDERTQAQASALKGRCATMVLTREVRTKVLSAFGGYLYCGRINDVEFLSPFFDLGTPAKNKVNSSVKEVLDCSQWFAVVNHNQTIFFESGLDFLGCPDLTFRDFLKRVFDVYIRTDGWRSCMAALNEQLKYAGIQLYEADIQYGESIIGLRPYDDVIGRLPFSMRNPPDLLDSFKERFNESFRTDLLGVFRQYDCIYSILPTNSSPFVSTSVSEEAIKRLCLLKVIDYTNLPLEELVFKVEPCNNIGYF